MLPGITEHQASITEQPANDLSVEDGCKKRFIPVVSGFRSRKSHPQLP